jgi:hypothetical protein
MAIVPRMSAFGVRAAMRWTARTAMKISLVFVLDRGNPASGHG